MKDFTGQSVMANYFRGIESVGGKVYFYGSGNRNLILETFDYIGN